MFSTVYTVLTAALLSGGVPPFPDMDYVPALQPGQCPTGYLWTYKPDGKGGTCREVIPYQPREGDWIFFDDMSEWWTFLYKIGNTAPPFHLGIVVKRPCGDLAVLESGPDDTLWIYVLPIVPRLHTFKGILQVRRCKRELTPEQSAALTAFAECQKGKRYAMWRLLLQGTPCKTKGGKLREKCAYTKFDRHRWLCAEIVVTASALIGLTDPDVIHGSNTYPLDVIENNKYDLSAVYEDYGYWVPRPEGPERH